MGNGSSTLLYVLNTLTKCISTVNKDSSSVKRYAGDPNKKIFTSQKGAADYKRKHK